MRKKILKIVFLAWIAIWLFLLARELFIKGAMREYRALFPLTLEGKRLRVTGERFYEFLAFANKNMPEGGSYKLAIPENQEIGKVRAAYYLYPHMEKEGADFLLAFDSPHAHPKGYAPFMELDENTYMLRKMKVR